MLSIEKKLDDYHPDTAAVYRKRFRKLKRRYADECQLMVRDDSRLAWSWISGTLFEYWTIDLVIYEMALTHYLYNYTEYPLLLQTRMPQLESNLAQCPIDIDVGFFIRSAVLPMWRLEAMLQKHPDGNFPKQWPWIDSNRVQQPADEEDARREQLVLTLKENFSSAG